MMNARGLSSVSGFDTCTFYCNIKGNCGPPRACVSYTTLKPNAVTKLGQILLDNKSFCCLTTPVLRLLFPLLGWGCPGSLGCFSASSAQPRARVGVQGTENKTCNSSSASCQGTGLSRNKAGPSPFHLRRNLCLGHAQHPLCAITNCSCTPQCSVHFCSSHSRLHLLSLSAVLHLLEYIEHSPSSLWRMNLFQTIAPTHLQSNR